MKELVKKNVPSLSSIAAYSSAEQKWVYGKIWDTDHVYCSSPGDYWCWDGSVMPPNYYRTKQFKHQILEFNTRLCIDYSYLPGGLIGLCSVGTYEKTTWTGGVKSESLGENQNCYRVHANYSNPCRMP